MNNLKKPYGYDAMMDHKEVRVQSRLAELQNCPPCPQCPVKGHCPGKK
jgi:hypothetical protein